MPRKEDQKNWKIKECFISDRDGWCNHCKTRTWKKGHKIYWMEKPNHTGWAACTDKKCYLEQGGKITQVATLKKDTPKNIGLDEFHWPSNEVKIPQEEAKLPGQQPPKKTAIETLIHTLDLSIEIWTEDFMRKTASDNDLGSQRELKNDDQFRGWIKCLHWCKKKAQECNSHLD